MQKLFSLGLTALALALSTGPAALAQNYSNAVVGLNPVGYWPLNEAVAPPQPLNLTAKNLGTNGSVDNGFYGAWYQPSGTTWYLTNNIAQAPAYTSNFDGSVGMLCQGAPGQYVIVPRNTNGVANASITLNPPFSIETWLKIGNNGSAFGTIVSQGGVVPLNTAGPNTNNPFYGGLGTGWGGVVLGQYQDYIFLMCQSTNGESKNNELDTSGYNAGKGFKVGTWVYLVATFDGTNEAIYTNGNLCVSKGIAPDAAGVRYIADPTSPLMIGNGAVPPSSYGQGYIGTIHDVAIYNEVLSTTSMADHFAAANGSYTNSYTNAVLADTPALYYRLNDPQSQVSAGYPSGTFPVANNYGVAGAAANGVYQPGTTPGVAGPSFAGFGANSKAVAINGWLGGVDVGGGSLPASLNPTGKTPLSLVTWFKSGPADAPGRFQEIIGHSDSSYRMALGQAAGENHFNPGPGPELQFTSPQDVVTNNFALNDGNWHMAAGVTDGTNEYLYLDGALAKSANNPTGISITGNVNDLLIGGDGEYTAATFNGSSVQNAIRTFDGEVAQVAFWTNALSPLQIQTLYGAAGAPPYFLQEPPASLAVNAGQNVSVSGASVRGAVPTTFQWYQNGSPVSGQTSATLTFTPAAPGNAGNYVLVASDAGGSVTSSVVSLTVYGPPTITQQSLTQMKIFAGSSPVLQVAVDGAIPLHYQWSLGGTPIAGATNSSYTVANISASGTYGCVITNFVSTASINPVTITVLADPTAPFPTAVRADGPVAYYRLDEASGTTAYDYVGGNNATYTNTTLGVPGYTSLDSVQSDPNETAAEFGDFPPANDYAGNVPSFLNFSTPNGSNAEFSVEAWVVENLYENAGNAIVALGYGGGGEQFVLDTGNNSAGDVRFFVRNAAGTVSAAGATNYIKNDGTWHHLIGVCDEAGGHVYLYMDGNQVASGTIAAGSGLLNSTTPLSIGARQSVNSGGINYDYQLYGDVDDVAVYNKALSAAQVQSHFYASGIAPTIVSVSPAANWITNQAANVVLTVNTLGTTPLTIQWTDNQGNNIPWGTNATLVITNIQPSQAGTYNVTVANLYGGPVSTQVNLTVTQVPQIISDITPQNVSVYADEPVTLSVAVSGTPPLSYQWYQDGVAIAGATTNTYTFLALSGNNTYYLSVTNKYSAGSATVSSTATVVGMPATILATNNYTDHLKITLAGYTRSETLFDFPVLVRLSTNLRGFYYSHFASPTGGDLRFTDAGGTRLIPSEIDEWNPAGESTVWVQVPALSGTNTTIYAYWGDPSATSPVSGTNVWVPQPWEDLPAYDVVYHLKEGAFPFADSTGQYPGLTGVAPAQTTGVVGTGAAFNGTTSFIDAGLVNLTNQFSVSAWVNIAPANNSEQTIWANKAGGWNTAGFDFYVNDYNTSDDILFFDNSDGVGGSVQQRTNPNEISFGQWHFLAGTIDGVNNVLHVYIDGVDQTINGTVDAAGFQTTNYVRLGALLTGTPGASGFLSFDGSIDEARIHTGIESSNWVWASYMTVAQTTNLETYSNVVSTVVNPLSPFPIHFTFAAGTLTLSGSGGTAGGTYYVIGTTNLLLPLAQWPVVTTSSYDGSGNFNVAIPVVSTTPAEYFRIRE